MPNDPQFEYMWEISKVKRMICCAQKEIKLQRKGSKHRMKCQERSWQPIWRKTQLHLETLSFHINEKQNRTVEECLLSWAHLENIFWYIFSIFSQILVQKFKWMKLDFICWGIHWEKELRIFFFQIVTVVKEISDLERWMDPEKMHFLFFFIFFCSRQINKHK